MSPEISLFNGAAWYLAFLFSTTLHEASHALVGLKLGDDTAHRGGQVTLDPIPHIRREPFGLGLFPIVTLILSLKSGGIGVFGFASAPFDIRWAIAYPKRAAWMALAGPAANFTLALLAGISIRTGIALGFFTAHGRLPYWQVVGPVSNALAEPLSVLFSLFFYINLLLGFFNLFPIPPLDGFSMLLFFVPDRHAIKIFQFRQKFGMVMPLLMFGFSGIFWRLFGPVFTKLSDIVAPL